MDHEHIYLTPDAFPKPDATDAEWIQQVTMLAEMAEKLARSTLMYLRINAPILLDADPPVLSSTLAAIGLSLVGIVKTGRQQLAKSGTQPLDVIEEQNRLVRDTLADPACPPDLREALLTVLAHNLEAEEHKAQPTEDTEWPEGGFVLGGDDQQ